jgi:hypothetical protein
VFFTETYREAMDVASRRQPGLIVIEIDREVGEVIGLAKDLEELVPDCAIAVAYKPDQAGLATL